MKYICAKCLSLSDANPTTCPTCGSKEIRPVHAHRTTCDCGNSFYLYPGVEFKCTCGVLLIRGTQPGPTTYHKLPKPVVDGGATPCHPPEIIPIDAPHETLPGHSSHACLCGRMFSISPRCTTGGTCNCGAYIPHPIGHVCSPAPGKPVPFTKGHGKTSAPDKPVPFTKGHGKTSYTSIDPEFLRDMCRTIADGVKDGRKSDDWKKLKRTDETERKYKDALLRHVYEGFDAAAIACNAMIIAYHERKKS